MNSNYMQRHPTNQIMSAANSASASATKRSLPSIVALAAVCKRQRRSGSPTLADEIAKLPSQLDRSMDLANRVFHRLLRGQSAGDLLAELMDYYTRDHSWWMFAVAGAALHPDLRQHKAGVCWKSPTANPLALQVDECIVFHARSHYNGQPIAQAYDLLFERFPLLKNVGGGCSYDHAMGELYQSPSLTPVALESRMLVARGNGDEWPMQEAMAKSFDRVRRVPLPPVKPGEEEFEFGEDKRWRISYNKYANATAFFSKAITDADRDSPHVAKHLSVLNRFKDNLCVAISDKRANHVNTKLFGIRVWSLIEKAWPSIDKDAYPINPDSTLEQCLAKAEIEWCVKIETEAADKAEPVQQATLLCMPIVTPPSNKDVPWKPGLSPRERTPQDLYEMYTHMFSSKYDNLDVSAALKVGDTNAFDVFDGNYTFFRSPKLSGCAFYTFPASPSSH